MWLDQSKVEAWVSSKGALNLNMHDFYAGHSQRSWPSTTHCLRYLFCWKIAPWAGLCNNALTYLWSCCMIELSICTTCHFMEKLPSKNVHFSKHASFHLPGSGTILSQQKHESWWSCMPDLFSWSEEMSPRQNRHDLGMSRKQHILPVKEHTQKKWLIWLGVQTPCINWCFCL